MEFDREKLEAIEKKFRGQLEDEDYNSRSKTDFLNYNDFYKEFENNNIQIIPLSGYNWWASMYKFFRLSKAFYLLNTIISPIVISIVAILCVLLFQSINRIGGLGILIGGLCGVIGGFNNYLQKSLIPAMIFRICLITIGYSIMYNYQYEAILLSTMISYMIFYILSSVQYNLLNTIIQKATPHIESVIVFGLKNGILVIKKKKSDEQSVKEVIDGWIDDSKIK